MSDGSGAGVYSPNSSCTWLLAPRDAVAVELQFDAFSTDGGADALTVLQCESPACASPVQIAQIAQEGQAALGPDAVMMGPADGTLGQGNQGGWTELWAEDCDDCSVEIGLPFQVCVHGVQTSTVHVISNSFLIFGDDVSTPYNSFSGTRPAQPTLFVGAADNSYQQVYGRTVVEGGVEGYAVRFEGTADTGGQIGAPEIIWEAQVRLSLCLTAVDLSSSCLSSDCRHVCVSRSSQTAESRWRLAGMTGLAAPRPARCQRCAVLCAGP